MIEFQKVRYRNFLSTGNQFNEINLNKPGLTLIVGTNGSGKTTCIDAITFALYGRAFRNINKPLIVNSINNKDCLVELEFNNNGKNYLVRRGIKPTVFEIFCDNTLVPPPADNRDYQTWFEENILDINFKTFSQIIVLSATNFVPFLELTAAARRQIVEDLLRLKVFSTMNVLAKQQLEKLQVTKQQLETKIQILDASIKNYQLAISHSSQAFDKLIERENEEIQQLQSEQVVLEKQISDLRLEISNIDNLDSLSTKLNEFVDLNKKISSKFNSLNTERKINHKQKHFFMENDICPSCDQEITVDFKSNKIEQLTQIIDELDDKIETLNQHEKKSTNRINEINEIIQQVGKINKQIEKVQYQIQALHSTIQNKQNNIQSILNQSKELDQSKNDSVEEQIKLKNLSEESLVKLEEKIEIEQQVIQLLKDDGIKAHIISYYLPIINQTIEKYLTELDFYVGFRFDENFNETIISRYQDKFSYANFSEGEKSRIDLAMLFAWREIAALRNSVKTNLLIMDEVLDSSMDFTGIELLLNVLYQIDQTVMIISHRETLIDKVNNTIRFRKKGHFSEMVDEHGE